MVNAESIPVHTTFHHLGILLWILSSYGNCWSERASLASLSLNKTVLLTQTPWGSCIWWGMAGCQALPTQKGGPQGKKLTKAAIAPSETPITRLGNSQACLNQLRDSGEPGRLEESSGKESMVAQKGQTLRKSKLEHQL